MSAYKRLSGVRVLIADAKTAVVTKTIGTNPGQKVQDYEIILANQKQFVSVNEINLILECTPQGQKLVKSGKVAFAYGKGRPPAWTRLKGAQVKQPGATYAPAVFNAPIALNQGIEADIVSDFHSIVGAAASNLTRPSRTIKARYLALQEIADVSRGLAERADIEAKSVLRLSDTNADLRERVELLERLAAQQDRMLALGHSPSAPSARQPLALPSSGGSDTAAAA